MNAEKALLGIEKVIREREPANYGRYHIGIIDGCVVCVGTYEHPKPWPILATFFERELRIGLRGDDWEKIKRKIATLNEIKEMT